MYPHVYRAAVALLMLGLLNGCLTATYLIHRYGIRDTTGNELVMKYVAEPAVVWPAALAQAEAMSPVVGEPEPESAGGTFVVEDVTIHVEPLAEDMGTRIRVGIGRFDGGEFLDGVAERVDELGEAAMEAHVDLGELKEAIRTELQARGYEEPEFVATGEGGGRFSVTNIRIVLEKVGEKDYVIHVRVGRFKSARATEEAAAIIGGVKDRLQGL